MSTHHHQPPTSAEAQHCCSDPGHDHQPAPTGLRAAVERASLPAVRALAALPPWLPFLAMLALMLVGAFLGGVLGGALLAVVVLVVTWLLYLSWPRLTPTERLMRVAVLALVLAVAVTQVIPR